MAKDIGTLIDAVKKAKTSLESAFGELESLGDEARTWQGEISRVLPANLAKDMQSIANVVEGSGQESLKSLLEFLENLPVKAYAAQPIPVADRIRSLAGQSQPPVESLGTGAAQPSQPESAIVAAREAVGIDKFIRKTAKSNYDGSIGGIDLNRLAESGIGADREGFPQLRELMADVPNKPENVREAVTRADAALELGDGPVDLNDFVRSSIRENASNKIAGFSFDQLKENGIGVRDDFMKDFSAMQKKNDTKGALNEIAAKVANAQRDKRLAETIPAWNQEPEVPEPVVIPFEDDKKLDWDDLANVDGSIDALPSIDVLSQMEIVDPVAQAMSEAF